MVKSLTKILILILLIALIGAGVVFVLQPLIIEIFPQKPEVVLSTTAKIIFVGDIMLDRGVEYMVKKQGNNDFAFPFAKIAAKLQAADLAFGNLESQISDQGQNIGSIYSFRADPEAIEGLKSAGFDIVSLANNHAFDYGRLALQDSINRLITAGISPIGGGNENQAFSPAIKTITGSTSAPSLRLAFFAYTDQGPESWQATSQIGIAQITTENLETIKADIKLAKELTDFVIVSFHMGNEYQTKPSENQILFSQALIDAGADLIICHHSHIIQGEEQYKNGYIFYGLGNFVFDQGFSQETLEGKMVELTLKKTREDMKPESEIKTHTVKLNQFFQPEIIAAP